MKTRVGFTALARELLPTRLCRDYPCPFLGHRIIFRSRSSSGEWKFTTTFRSRKRSTIRSASLPHLLFVVEWTTMWHEHTDLPRGHWVAYGVLSITKYRCCVIWLHEYTFVPISERYERNTAAFSWRLCTFGVLTAALWRTSCSASEYCIDVDWGRRVVVNHVVLPLRGGLHGTSLYPGIIICLSSNCLR